MTAPRHLPLTSSLGAPAGAGTLLPSELLGGPPPVETGADGEADGDGSEKLLLVGDIAKAVGKTVRAIHHYEDVGLLRPHARSKGRYRLYDEGALARVRWISKLHDLGMSLSQIQELVEAWEKAPSASGAMTRIRAIYVQKLQETRAQIAHLASLEHELAASIEYLDTCDRCDPAELAAACSNCHVHDEGQHQPALVAGIHGVVRQRGACACEAAAAMGALEAFGKG